MLKNYHRKILAAALLVALLTVSFPHVGHAQAGGLAWVGSGSRCGFGDIITGNLVQCAIYLSAMAADTVLSLFVAIGAWAVNLALKLSSNVVNMDVVQKGFSASLSIANLGFVFGIIVIALATILRSTSYGIKQVLWKLVVAAIAVNFGLVIAGTILKFSDNFTDYFNAGFGSGNFTNAIVGALKPNAYKLPPAVNLATLSTFNCLPSGTAGPPSPDCIAAKQAATAAEQTNDSLIKNLDTWMKEVLGLVFIIVFEFIIAFTLFALAIMLIIRFIYIGILLVLLPLAWLMWIFPKFSHLNSKWWSLFLKWAFFPAIATFFLYLAVLTASSTDIFSGPAPTLANSPAAAIGIATNNPNFVNAGAQTLLMVGLALGGLFAANSLGIMGANVAMGMVKSAGGAVRGYVGKQGKRAVSRAVPAKAKEALESGRVPGIPKRVQSWMGRGLGQVEKAGGANLVDKEAAWAREKAKNPAEGARLLAGSLNREQQMALLKQMANQGDIGKVKTVNSKSIDEFRSDEKAFKNAGQEKLTKDLDKAIGHTVTQNKAAQAIGAEASKKQADIDTIDKNRASLDEKSKKIEAAENTARIRMAQNPNATFTDTDGAVTGKAGTEMNVKDFVDTATRRYVEVETAKKKADDMKAKIMEEAKAKATITDEKGVLGTPWAEVNAQELIDKEAEELMSGQTKGDVAKMALNDIYGKGQRFGLDEKSADVLAEAFTGAIARKAPQFIGSMMPKMKSDQLEKFQEFYMRMLKTMEKQARTTEEANKIAQRIESFNKSVLNNLTYGEYEYGGGEEKEAVSGGGTKPPAPTPPTGSGKTS